MSTSSQEQFISTLPLDVDPPEKKASNDDCFGLSIEDSSFITVTEDVFSLVAFEASNSFDFSLVAFDASLVEVLVEVLVANGGLVGLDTLSFLEEVVSSPLMLCECARFRDVLDDKSLSLGDFSRPKSTSLSSLEL